MPQWEELAHTQVDFGVFWQNERQLDWRDSSVVLIYRAFTSAVRESNQSRRENLMWRLITREISGKNVRRGS
jgi:hypothetical protein